MKNQKLVWRLSKLPTPAELRELVKDKIITQDEAREILFSQESGDLPSRDKESLESEIKFLRELVEKLSSNQRSTITETIKVIREPYWKYEWYKPYQVWCANDTSYYAASDNKLNQLAAQAQNFSDIQTFN